jgi:AraC-like DNA-binding protein
MDDRVDRLTGLLHRFGLHARVLHSGGLSGSLDLEQRQGVSRLHLLRRGALEVPDPGGGGVLLRQPSAVFYPRSWRHRIVADAGGAEVLSAAIDFGSGDENPLLRGLPAMMCLPLTEMPSLDATLGILFVEATSRRCGHATVLDRLTEVLFVQLLRFAIERQLIQGGVVAGLADARLARALTAMHDDPAHDWSLALLAAEAGMSRSRFAARFAAVVGVPAMEYLMRWRIGVAQGLLRRGQPPKVVAQEVGYGRSSTFGRAFAHVVGTTPTAWLRARRG